MLFQRVQLVHSLVLYNCYSQRESERKREKKQKKMGQYLSIDIPISEKFIASVYASENTEQPSRKLQLRYLLTDITAFFASFPVYDKNDLPLSKSLLNTSKYDKPLRHVICGPQTNQVTYFSQ